MARLEFELTYYYAAVQHISHHATKWVNINVRIYEKKDQEYFNVK